MSKLSTLVNKRILITCGPTWVPIDDIRIISNRSSGQLGHLIAGECAKAGGKVTLLEGPLPQPLISDGIRVRPFTWFKELEALLKQELKKKYDIVIHAAAVADYEPERTSEGKIKSNRASWSLRLVRTKKLIGEIKKWNPHVLLVGFKQESSITPESIPAQTASLFREAGCDLVIANTAKETAYQGFLVAPDGSLRREVRSRSAMAKSLTKELEKRL